MRIIDADVLYQKTEELEKQAREASRQAITEPTKEKWNTILAERSAFKYDITQMPTIDAVPVVRCKDCKYYEQNDDDYEGEQGEDSWGVCRNTGAGMMRCGYCSYGERKDDV